MRVLSDICNPDTAKTSNFRVTHTSRSRADIILLGVPALWPLPPCDDFSLKDCSQGYLIGSIVEYRRDPEGTAVTLSLQRRHTAAQLETTELAPKPTYVNYSRPYRVQERVLARASSEPEIRAAPPMSRPHTFPRAATSSSPYRPPDESDENLSNEELAWYEDLLG
jgi:hypothetical protein